jgi:hypothetical protein
LEGIGTYEARIACNLWSRKGVRFYTLKFPKGCHPYFTQSGKDREDNPDQYIANFCDGAVAGFKYFKLGSAQTIALTVKGKGGGSIIVSTDPEGGHVCAKVAIARGVGERKVEAPFSSEKGVLPLYFKYQGKGYVDFIGFTLS